MKPAKSSSVLRPEWNANKTVDGDERTNVYCDSCLHTNVSGSPAYLLIDLQGTYAIERVEIVGVQCYTGTTCDGGQLMSTDTCFCKYM